MIRIKMKKSLFYILSFLLVANAFSATKKTGWEEDGLKGKVKERVEIDYNIKRQSDEDIKEIEKKSIT